MNFRIKNSFFVIVAALLWGSVACQQSNSSNESCDTYTELPDPTADTSSDWSSVENDLHASFATIDKRFSKSVSPQIEKENKHKIEGWKGEKLSAQVLLWTTEDIESVSFQFSEFKGQNGNLNSDIAKARFVRYVMTDEFAGGCGHRKPEDFAASLAPDVLDNVSCMDLEAKQVRPVWISVTIPSDASPGEYTSTLKIAGKDVPTQELELVLEVIDRELPPPSEWTFHLDQWQHPSAVARVDSVELWSEEHFKAMKPVMKMLADAGQKVITTTLNKDPWNVQTYDPYEDMIIWIKKEDESWEYDYTVFDKWVKFMMDLGIKKQINAYSIVPWNNELHYIDEASGDTINVEADPDTPEFEEMWKPFLKDFSEHLDEKGWLEITNIAMDERDKESMDIAFALIEEVAPKLGVAFADNQKTYQRYPNSADVSVSANDPFDEKDLEDRKSRGVISTFYIYCGNEFPNQFTFSDPAEATYLGWYALAGNFDGFLRWSFNSWVKDPLLDSRFRTWPAGDTYTVYPDARSSIRHERTVEGIQDFEKAKIIRQQLIDQGRLEEVEALDNAIRKLKSPKRKSGWNDDLNAAKNLLNEISKKL